MLIAGNILIFVIHANIIAITALAELGRTSHRQVATDCRILRSRDAKIL